MPSSFMPSFFLWCVLLFQHLCAHRYSGGIGHRRCAATKPQTKKVKRKAHLLQCGMKIIHLVNLLTYVYFSLLIDHSFFCVCPHHKKKICVHETCYKIKLELFCCWLFTWVENTFNFSACLCLMMDLPDGLAIHTHAIAHIKGRPELLLAYNF